MTEFPQMPPAPEGRIVQAVTYLTNSVDRLTAEINRPEETRIGQAITSLTNSINKANGQMKGLEEAMRLLARAVEDANSLAEGQDSIKDAARIDAFKKYQGGIVETHVRRDK